MSCGQTGFLSPVHRVDYSPQNAEHKAANAVDFPAPDGSPARAVVSGRVLFVRSGLPDVASLTYYVPAAVFGRGRWGNCVVIAGDDGCFWLEAHFKTVSVSPGQRVAMGQVIATVGQSGHTTGPHTHVQLIGSGSIIDAMARGARTLTPGQFLDELPGGEAGARKWLGKVKNTPSVAGALADPLGVVSDIGHFFGFFLDPKNWLRLVEFVGGAGLMAAGLYWLGKDIFPEQAAAVTTTAKRAATAAAA